VRARTIKASLRLFLPFQERLLTLFLQLLLSLDCTTLQPALRATSNEGLGLEVREERLAYDLDQETTAEVDDHGGRQAEPEL
jgi:hypothetical protein